MTVNIRGDVPIVIGEHVYIMRPTFEALHSIELDLNAGLITLAKKLSEGMLTLDELCTMIIRCVEAVPEQKNYNLREAIKSKLIVSGMSPVYEAVAILLTGVFEGIDTADV